jgi:hypothetical protein
MQVMLRLITNLKREMICSNECLLLAALLTFGLVLFDLNVLERIHLNSYAQSSRWREERVQPVSAQQTQNLPKTAE